MTCLPRSRGFCITMKFGIALCLILVGCGDSYGSLSNIPPNDLGPGPMDAGSEAEAGVMDAGHEAAPIHNPPSGLCCQIENNETDSALWYNDRYSCFPPDASSAFNPPWICQVNDAGMCGGSTGIECLTCDMPACVVGMSCLGVNGTGVVLPCNQQDW